MSTLRMNPARRTSMIAPNTIIKAPKMADLSTASSTRSVIYAEKEVWLTGLYLGRANGSKGPPR